MQTETAAAVATTATDLVLVGDRFSCIEDWNERLVARHSIFTGT